MSKSNIDQKINGLNYNPLQVLAFNGKPEENFVPAEGVDMDGKFIIIRREKTKINNENFDIAVVESIRDRTYPGALLLANESLVNNMPTSLICDRAPVNLRINLSGIGVDGTAEVKEPNYSNVSAAIDRMLEEWYRKYATSNSLPANYSYHETRAYSEDQLSVALGCNFKILNVGLNIDFKSISANKKSVYVLAFKQIYYTVSIDAPSNPSGFFANNVTWEDLVDSGVNEKNPPAYVGSVSYGRMIYVAIETDYISDEIEANLKLAIKDNKLDADVMHKSIFDGCKYSAVVIGGNAEAHTKVVTKNFAEIERLITNYAVLSKDNPAVPIAYTAVFMKNNVMGVINGAAEYVTTTSTTYTSGSVNLKHTGGYTARFYVTWKERSFENGVERLSETKGWERNGNHVTAPFHTTIPIPANAVQLHVKATYATALVWEPWRTIVDQPILLAPNVQVSIWGTTLNSKSSVEVR